jgi:hypothetical protein
MTHAEPFVGILVRMANDTMSSTVVRGLVGTDTYRELWGSTA